MRIFEIYKGEPETTVKPFTAKEIERINKVLTTGNDISFKSFGGMIETELQNWEEIQHALVNPHSTKKSLEFKGKPKFSDEKIDIKKLVFQDQNGVGNKNLFKLLNIWNTLPIPELVALSGGLYWVMEGHHRIVLQILAGRKKIVANVEFGYMKSIPIKIQK